MSLTVRQVKRHILHVGCIDRLVMFRYEQSLHMHSRNLQRAPAQMQKFAARICWCQWKGSVNDRVIRNRTLWRWVFYSSRLHITAILAYNNQEKICQITYPNTSKLTAVKTAENLCGHPGHRTWTVALIITRSSFQCKLL